MSFTRNFLTGIGAGAGLMYLLDPDRGRRRRAVLRDKFTSGVVQTGHGFGKALRDARNRAQGAVAVARSVMHRSECSSDSVLAARVRAKLGRVAAHPHAIQVSAHNGTAMLEGPALVEEMNRVVSAVRSVPGVHHVENHLAPYLSAAEIPSLQGKVPPEPKMWELAESNWSPAFRAAVGIVGGWITVKGMRRDGVLGTLGSLAGGALLARAATNMEFKRVVGIGGHRPIDLQKTINVHAPVDDVWAFWTNYRNFPKFMSHLKEVHDRGNGRSHWVAEGPGGVPVAWDAEITEQIPKRLLRWRSVPGSQIENTGCVRFDPNPDGGTRVTIRMSYSPPAGMLGHVAASLFRRDPKHEIEDDLARLKSLIEYGKTRAHGETVRRDEVRAPAAM